MEPAKRPATATPAALVNWTGAETQRRDYPSRRVMFAQGAAAADVLYVESGTVQLSVVSHAGKVAVIAMLDAGHFFGEGCLAGQARRMATAKTASPCTIVSVDKAEMVRHLHSAPAFADEFLVHMLSRNIRIEEDLVDQLFNSSEKRLARTLLLLARYGEPQISHRALPKVSQETLAEFRRLGFIEYNGGLKINNSLLSVVLRD